MTEVTYALSYYENPNMLQEQYRRIGAVPRALRHRLRMIVVDDGSPRHPAVPGDTHGVPLRIYRMVQDVRWNQDACRNLAAANCETSWMLLTDMDHAPSRGLWRHLLGKSDWESDVVYRFKRISAPDMGPYKSHPNTWFITRQVFDAAGGYDERFAGWYGTDRDFERRLEKMASVRMYGGPPVIRFPREVIPDASTTTYARKTQADRDNISAIKMARELDPDWKPLRLTFPHLLVYDSEEAKHVS